MPGLTSHLTDPLHATQQLLLALSAGATVMAFLAGPPDRGRGCVLRRKPVKAPYIHPAMTEISYTSLALGMQPVPLLPTHSNNSSAKGNNNEPAQVGTVYTPYNNNN